MRRCRSISTLRARLAPTTDLRALLETVLVDHLRLPLDGVERIVFPDGTGLASLREIVRA